LLPGANLWTGANSMLMLYTGNQKPFAEIDADTMITYRGVTSQGENCMIRLAQESGNFCVVSSEQGYNTFLETPVGTAAADGQICAQAVAEGWCFMPMSGKVVVDMGEEDSDPEDNIAFSSNDGGIQFSTSGAWSACALADVTATPTPERNARPTPTATLRPDPCAANGGLQWEGDVCLCNGQISHTIICNDGSKSDLLTGQTCQPQQGTCDQNGNPVHPGNGGDNDNGAPPVPSCTPSPVGFCDGIDNDCDGLIDEGGAADDCLI
jgi:hypothetical protein